MAAVSQQRFRLQQGGIETGGTGKARSYEFDVGREYEVYFNRGGDRQLVGTCTIEAGPADTHTVVPAFLVTFEPDDCEFFAAFRTDADGIAHLHNVWMTVQGSVELPDRGERLPNVAGGNRHYRSRCRGAGARRAEYTNKGGSAPPGVPVFPKGVQPGGWREPLCGRLTRRPRRGTEFDMIFEPTGRAWRSAAGQPRWHDNLECLSLRRS